MAPETEATETTADSTVPEIRPDGDRPEDLTNGDVFAALMTGDEVLWDEKTVPLTVTTGHFEAKAQYDMDDRVFVEGPQGGQKTLIQNQKDADSIRVVSSSMTDGSEWITNLRIV